MPDYLVIATYRDNGQRYATTVNAATPGWAEHDAQIICAKENKGYLEYGTKPLLIAGVLLDGKVVA